MRKKLFDPFQPQRQRRLAMAVHGLLALAAYFGRPEPRTWAEAIELVKYTASGLVRRLLGTSAKSAKAEKYGVDNRALFMEPAEAARISGISTCLMATIGCGGGCLVTGARLSMKQNEASRLAKTLYLWLDPEAFIEQLLAEVNAAHRLALAKDHGLSVRFNGTTDILWGRLLQSAGRTLPAGVRFVDYTKMSLPSRIHCIEAGFHLTYSFNESAAAPVHSRHYAAAGWNTALVVAGQTQRITAARAVQRDLLDRYSIGGETFYGRHVVDGDAHDLRYLDPHDVWVVLHAKSKALKDKTGFVLRFNDSLNLDDNQHQRLLAATT